MASIHSVGGIYEIFTYIYVINKYIWTFYNVFGQAKGKERALAHTRSNFISYSHPIRQHWNFIWNVYVPPQN